MRFRPLAIAMLQTLVSASLAAAQTSRPEIADASFRAFLPAFEGALTGMIGGDSTAWFALLAREPTLFTPFGGVRVGHEAVRKQYAFAAGRNASPKPGLVVEFEYLSVDVSGDLACVVEVEHISFRRVGSDTLARARTRATHIFRREDGAWKLAHRHMDHLQEPTAPQGP